MYFSSSIIQNKINIFNEIFIEILSVSSLLHMFQYVAREKLQESLLYIHEGNTVQPREFSGLKVNLHPFGTQRSCFIVSHCNVILFLFMLLQIHIGK